MNRFSIDLDRQLQTWFATDFAAVLRQKYGDEARLAVIVLDARGEPAHELTTHSDERSTGPLGLLDNARHKLNFVQRTGLPSSEASSRPDLLEPGDFPHGGAGIHRGYMGGASGLTEESDWWCLCRVVDRLIELRAAAAMPAIAASKNRQPGWKYLDGPPLTLEHPLGDAGNK